LLKLLRNESENELRASRDELKSLKEQVKLANSEFISFRSKQQVLQCRLTEIEGIESSITEKSWYFLRFAIQTSIS